MAHRRRGRFRRVHIEPRYSGSPPRRSPPGPPRPAPGRCGPDWSAPRPSLEAPAPASLPRAPCGDPGSPARGSPPDRRVVIGRGPNKAVSTAAHRSGAAARVSSLRAARRHAIASSRFSARSPSVRCQRDPEAVERHRPLDRRIVPRQDRQRGAVATDRLLDVLRGRPHPGGRMHCPGPAGVPPKAAALAVGPRDPPAPARPPARSGVAGRPNVGAPVPIVPRHGSGRDPRAPGPAAGRTAPQPPGIRSARGR